ncbi:hypothetical protein DW775_05920 [Agathobacter rectalis]|jgi:hypothetical protein|uniref:Uncharacterized protein n=1 Tax=Agathobacter rectalis TaxID=39491 RepID=A0A413ME27_9FIRM|nr:hypothetical protein [Agathobacter rectalis]MBP3770467.1 hypothetical protein [Lachnospira sp.]RGZ19647.1 hypothetical protein DXA03_02270 [Agathobacter rectalis]RGZ74155.1 hypothetical protein DW975_12645 [Agathobacter rectalis]RHD95457.1 hypothetical protein DW775_05920 [Agathobacter rectalis]
MQYNGMTPPFELISFEDMKKKQAEQYFVWYIDTIEQRIQNLEKYINLTGTRMVLDKTPNSLIELWDWFSNHIEVCTKDEQELMLELTMRPDWIKAHIMSDRRKLSLNTIMIAVDISAYFGEVFIKNNPNIYWGYLSKPKKLHGVNRPRLLGFAGDMSVYPYGRVEMCIWKTIETVDNMHLFNMYQVCLKMI